MSSPNPLLLSNELMHSIACAWCFFQKVRRHAFRAPIEELSNQGDSTMGGARDGCSRGKE